MPTPTPASFQRREPVAIPFRLDAEDQGLKEQWFLPRRRPRDLTVKRAGSHWLDVKKNYGVAGPGWHFIPFDMPADRAADGALLHFGSVDSDCRVWLNGEFLGEHHVWDEPFHFDIAKTVRPGRNEPVEYPLVGRRTSSVFNGTLSSTKCMLRLPSTPLAGPVSMQTHLPRRRARTG